MDNLFEGNNKAYYSEPTPLKRKYPKKSEGWLFIITFTLCVLFGLAGLTILLPSREPFPGSWWLQVIIALGLLGVSRLLFLVSNWVDQWEYTYRWKNAFKENNRDIRLNYKAIDQTIRYMHRNTGYQCINFEEVASVIAISQRLQRPYESERHTTFSSEVLQNYKHFAFHTHELAKTYVPKDRK